MNGALKRGARIPVTDTTDQPRKIGCEKAEQHEIQPS